MREKPPKRLSTTIREGSPPRVREKPQLGFACWCVPGITPACAGKTYIRQVSSGVVWDHPRVCGKNSSLSLRLAPISGSPPRVREKLNHSKNFFKSFRITPACAGKTSCCNFGDSWNRDHPRVCGKNSYFTLNGVYRPGSPPRVREKRKMFYDMRFSVGITPACAGKTQTVRKKCFHRQDHPRVCGKNLKGLNPATLLSGSPPRVREKLSPFRSIILYLRITPACAGKTWQVGDCLFIS